jgi:WhiB family redox-sensing transcriptional regulator
MMEHARAEWRKLPKPNEENYRWQELGACRKQDPELFFLPENSRMSDKNRRLSMAKKVCGTCPVIEDCLKFAIETEQKFGVWGGLSEEELARTIRRRKRNAGRRDV